MFAAAVLFLLLLSQGDRQQLQQKEARESSVRRCPGFLIHLYVASIEKHASSRRNFGTSLFTYLLFAQNICGHLDMSFIF